MENLKIYDYKDKTRCYKIFKKIPSNQVLIGEVFFNWHCFVL